MNKDIHAPFIGVSVYIISYLNVLNLRRKALRSQYQYTCMYGKPWLGLRCSRRVRLGNNPPEPGGPARIGRHI